MTNTLNTGWTDEDKVIWRERKIPAHMLYLRYQHHMIEYNRMLELMKDDRVPLAKVPSYDIGLLVKDSLQMST